MTQARKKTRSRKATQSHKAPPKQIRSGDTVYLPAPDDDAEPEELNQEEDETDGSASQE